MHQGFRWTFTLVRAALEGAAQSMWLTQAKSTHECVARLIRTVRHDIHEETRAWEAMWRVCSAAAHGKDWAIRELQVFTEGHEWRPGQYHLTGYPNPVKLTRMLEDATEFLNLAMIRYLLRMGADVDRELRVAIIAAAEGTPNTDGGAMVRAMREKFDGEETPAP